MKTLFTTIAITVIALSSFAQVRYVENEILIQVNPAENAEEIISDYVNLGSPRIDKNLSDIMNIYKISFSNNIISAPEILRVLRKDDRILNAQLNHFIDKRETIPNDPQLSSQWQHINNGSSGGTEDADIDSDLAWDITTGGLTALGDTIVACVIEGGNLLHPDLIDNAWFNYNEIPDNGIDDDQNGYIDDYRGWNVQSETDEGVYQGGHGTNVMGMIGAKGNNELGVVGANWDVKIMSVTGENLGNEASVIEAYNYPLVQRKLYATSEGERGAFVVVTNASWGIDFGDPADVPLWAAFYDTLGVYGILNCGATANNNVDIDVVGDIPTAVESDYMISVTATNNNDLRTFSAYGIETVDLGAPGSNIFTTAGGAGYTNTSGTSFASPLTAGVISLLYSAPCPQLAEFAHDDPQGAADYVRLMLFEGVDPIENLANEVATGGRLNAYNSLQLIMGSCGEDICLSPSGFSYEMSEDTLYTFTWSNFGENDTTAIRYREVGTDEWTYIAGITGGEYTFDNLAYCTAFEFETASECQGDIVEELEYSSNTIVLTDGCCEAPEELFQGELTETEAELSWDFGFNIESYEIYYRITGESDWLFSGSSEIGEYLLGGLKPCTFYDILLKPGCVEGFDEAIEIQIRTKGCGHCIDAEYCDSFGEDTPFEYIESVAIGDYLNESGDDGGYNFIEETGLELEAGGVYDIELTPGFQDDAYNELFTLWLDINQDGEFTSEELLFESPNGSQDAVNGEITIPADAVLGQTRMRIAIKWANANEDWPDGCVVLEEGEVEDYCLTIVESTVGIEEFGIEEFEVFPNPSDGKVNIQLGLNDAASQTYKVEIMDISGKLIEIRNVQNGLNTYRFDLAPGAYIYRLSTNGEAITSGKLIITRY